MTSKVPSLKTIIPAAVVIVILIGAGIYYMRSRSSNGGLDEDPTVNRTPLANAGPDQVIEAGEEVILDGSQSSDPDGDTLIYHWDIDDTVDENSDGYFDNDRDYQGENVSHTYPDPDEVKVLEELLGLRFPALTVSAETGDGLEEIGAFLFKALEIVRVYTKTPGKPAETDKPFTVRRGGTVLDVARLVHKDIAEGLKFARMWGTDVYDGQQVGPDHLVSDGDLVELHV